MKTKTRGILGLGLSALAVGMLLLLVETADAGIKRNLRVHNGTKETITVYVNGGSGRKVYPGRTYHWYVGDGEDDLTTFYAENARGERIKQGFVKGHLRDYDWYVP